MSLKLGFEGALGNLLGNGVCPYLKGPPHTSPPISHGVCHFPSMSHSFHPGNMERDSTSHTLVTHFTDETTEPQRGGVSVPGSHVTQPRLEPWPEPVPLTSLLPFVALHPFLGPSGLGMLNSPNMVFPAGPGSPGLDAGWLGAWVWIQFLAPSRGLILSEPQFPPL